MKVFGLIMAGGKGTRFWPISRTLKPKQVLNLNGEGTMVDQTITRISEEIDNENVYIVTNVEQVDIVKSAIRYTMVKANVLAEPEMKNTAACILYSALKLYKKYGDAVMCVFPADHYIGKQSEFNNVLEKAINVAKSNDKLVTIGITPTYPATGYGYIKYNCDKEEGCRNEAYDVIEFKEKPKLSLAKEYVESGKYLWNSGMFVWKISVIIRNFQRFLPKLYNHMARMLAYIDTDEEFEVLKTIYKEIDSISIDYGILERSDDVLVIPSSLEWNDVGSWESLGSICKCDEDANIIKGKNVNINSKNCVIYSEKQLVATIGIENMIVVATEDAVLVCPKRKSQEVKDVVDKLKDMGYNAYI